LRGSEVPQKNPVTAQANDDFVKKIKETEANKLNSVGK